MVVPFENHDTKQKQIPSLKLTEYDLKQMIWNQMDIHGISESRSGNYRVGSEPWRCMLRDYEENQVVRDLTQSVMHANIGGGSAESNWTPRRRPKCAVPIQSQSGSTIKYIVDDHKVRGTIAGAFRLWVYFRFDDKKLHEYTLSQSSGFSVSEHGFSIDTREIKKDLPTNDRFPLQPPVVIEAVAFKLNHDAYTLKPDDSGEFNLENELILENKILACRIHEFKNYERNFSSFFKHQSNTKALPNTFSDVDFVSESERVKKLIAKDFPPISTHRGIGRR